MASNTSPCRWGVLLAPLLITTLIAGCGTEPESLVAEAVDETPTAASETQEFPTGSFEKTATREEALAEGVPAEVLDRPDEFLGLDEFHITHTFHEDGRFAERQLHRWHVGR